MKIQKLLILFCGLTLILGSCKKESKNDSFEKIPFAKETVDEGKANLEESGIEMINSMRDLRDAPAMESMDVAMHFMDKANPFGDDELITKAFFKTFDALSQVKKGNNNPGIVLKSLQVEDDEWESIQEAFSELAGVYSWNYTTENWVKSNASDRIEFKFPSTKTGTTNNASLLITYQGTTQYPSLIPDYTGDLPVKLEIGLTAAGQKHLEYKLNFTYNNEGIPTSIASSLKVSDFLFTWNWVYSTKAASVSYGVKHGAKILVDFKLAANGDFSKKNLDKAFDEESEEDVEVDQVLHSANGHFQVMNVKILGKVNVKGIAAANRTIYPDNHWNDPNFDEKEATIKEAEAMNKNVELVAVYADSNKKIAQGEFYQYSYTEKWYGYTYEYHSVELRFIFADGSKGDLETYFGSGFGDLVAEMNAFIDEMNEKYDLGIDYLDYED